MFINKSRYRQTRQIPSCPLLLDTLISQVILAPLQFRSHHHITFPKLIFSLSLFLSASLILSYIRITACVHRCQSTRQANAESKFIFGVIVERKTNSLPARTGKEVAGRVAYTLSSTMKWETLRSIDRQTKCALCSRNVKIDCRTKIKEDDKRDETKAIPTKNQNKKKRTRRAVA